MTTTCFCSGPRITSSPRGIRQRREGIFPGFAHFVHRLGVEADQRQKLERLALGAQGQVRYRLKTPVPRRHHAARARAFGFHRPAGGAGAGAVGASDVLSRTVCREHRRPGGHRADSGSPARARRRGSAGRVARAAGAAAGECGNVVLNRVAVAGLVMGSEREAARCARCSGERHSAGAPQGTAQLAGAVGVRGTRILANVLPVHAPALHWAAAWQSAVERAMAENASTVAVLSIEEILKPDGYVARLRAAGYRVEDP